MQRSGLNHFCIPFSLSCLVSFCAMGLLPFHFVFFFACFATLIKVKNFSQQIFAETVLDCSFIYKFR